MKKEVGRVEEPQLEARARRRRARGGPETAGKAAQKVTKLTVDSPSVARDPASASCIRVNEGFGMHLPKARRNKGDRTMGIVITILAIIGVVAVVLWLLRRA